MKTIETRYHPATTHRSPRITASDRDGNRITMAISPELDFSKAHPAAARALCVKMRWAGVLQGGHTKAGMVWTFINPDDQILLTPADVGM